MQPQHHLITTGFSEFSRRPPTRPTTRRMALGKRSFEPTFILDRFFHFSFRRFPSTQSMTSPGGGHRRWCGGRNTGRCCCDHIGGVVQDWSSEALQLLRPLETRLILSKWRWQWTRASAEVPRGSGAEVPRGSGAEVPRGSGADVVQGYGIVGIWS